MARSLQSNVWLAALLAVLVGGCTSTPDSGTSDETPTEPANVQLTHDFSKDSPNTQTFLIPDAEDLYNVRFKVGGDGPTVCNPGSSARLVVETPEKKTYADLQSHTPNVVVSNGSGNTPCSEKSEQGVRLTPGTWTIVFSGTGAVVGTVEITPA